MPKAWKDIDLEGGGLQAVNRELARRQRRRPTAYLLWLLLPSGAHRFYLHEPRGGSAYPALAALAVLLAVMGLATWALLPLAGLLGWGLIDLWWIDRRVSAVNKELRLALMMRPGARPPADYRGRFGAAADDPLPAYLKDKARERAGHGGVQAGDAGTASPATGSRAPSFQEQEAMLRELARRRQARDEDRS